MQKWKEKSNADLLAIRSAIQEISIPNYKDELECRSENEEQIKVQIEEHINHLRALSNEIALELIKRVDSLVE